MNEQSLHVGNLAPGKVISFEFVFIQRISSEDMSYRYYLMQKYPQIVVMNNFYVMDENKGASVQATIEINIKGKLTRLVINKNNYFGTFTEKYIDDYSKVIITTNNSNYRFTEREPRLLKILFRTTNTNAPKLYTQYNPKLNEISYTLNYLFSSNKINIPLANEPDEEEGVSYYANYQSDNEEYSESPGLFVFLIVWLYYKSLWKYFFNLYLLIHISS